MRFLTIPLRKSGLLINHSKFYCFMQSYVQNHVYKPQSHCVLHLYAIIQTIRINMTFLVWNKNYCFADLQGNLRVLLSIKETSKGRYDVMLADGKRFLGTAYYPGVVAYFCESIIKNLQAKLWYVISRPLSLTAGKNCL